MLSQPGYLVPRFLFPLLFPSWPLCFSIPYVIFLRMPHRGRPAGAIGGWHEIEAKAHIGQLAALVFQYHGGDERKI
ncbi:MAG: hypothetical protein BGO99_00855 [Nitrosospira sp. 56-18]|nr:MAG: hypothetical protein BGO99_00855 [Nitrosospira sp. 56-18]